MNSLQVYDWLDIYSIKQTPQDLHNLLRARPRTRILSPTHLREVNFRRMLRGDLGREGDALPPHVQGGDAGAGLSRFAAAGFGILIVDL